jgi:hypothetical protein
MIFEILSNNSQSSLGEARLLTEDNQRINRIIDCIQVCSCRSFRKVKWLGRSLSPDRMRATRLF